MSSLKQHLVGAPASSLSPDDVARVALQTASVVRRLLLYQIYKIMAYYKISS